MKLKICNATGNGVCINCNGIPPKINGVQCGELCRKMAQKIIDTLVCGDIVGYSYETNKFYKKIIFTNSVYELDSDDWEVLE